MTLSVQLSDDVYTAVRARAEQSGTSPAEFAATTLERQFGSANGAATDAERQAAQARFERHFGAVHVPWATGTDNEAMDADSAREYGDNHEGA